LINKEKALDLCPPQAVGFCSNDCTAGLDDFKTPAIQAHGKKKKLFSRDKGQKSEIKQFIEATLFEEIYRASLATFKIIESIRAGMCSTILIV
jgi:hypothetical protein